MSSKRHQRRRTCTDKRRFESAAEARRGIEGLRRRGLRGLAIGTYKCRFCGGWHIGRRERRGPGMKMWEINQSGY